MVKAQNGWHCWVRQFLEQWSHSWPHPFLSPPIPFHWCCHVLLLVPPRTFSPPSTPPPQGHTARIEEINGVRMELFSTTFSLWWGQKWKWVAWKCKEFSTGSPSIWSCPVSPLSPPPPACCRGGPASLLQSVVEKPGCYKFSAVPLGLSLKQAGHSWLSHYGAFWMNLNWLFKWVPATLEEADLPPGVLMNGQGVGSS